MLEIERKFIVTQPPADLTQYPCTEITQGYITTGDGDAELRLRKEQSRHYLTIKRGSGLQREEFQVELTGEQFALLWPAAEGRKICKLRYKIPCDDALIELDVYHDNLEGLLTAEVEFASAQAAQAFAAPAWFGREVTNIERYKNSQLARFGLPG